jgi:conjugal transfer mating pair stabilization protein TraG
VAFLVTVFYAGVVVQQQSSINPSRLRPLLEVVAQAESKGNYNAYFGNATNQEVHFTSMSIQEVLAWQEDLIARGGLSSAVGRYQIINTTLEGLVGELQLSKQERFDERTQDTMAVALVKRRGAESYLKGSLTEEEFAANLAKEWASLPAVVGQNPTESYYASDGLNKASVSPAEILHTIRTLRK